MKMIRIKHQNKPGSHLCCTARKLVPLSHFKIAKLSNDHITFQICLFTVSFPPA